MRSTQTQEISKTDVSCFKNNQTDLQNPLDIGPNLQKRLKRHTTQLIVSSSFRMGRPPVKNVSIRIKFYSRHGPQRFTLDPELDRCDRETCVLATKLAGTRI